MAKYSVHQQPIETLLTWIKSGEIAIPEIQRPFVWKASRVRDFIDSLYKGYPVGYIITWRNPDLKQKDGTLSAGKKILIDGQQRITSLTAAIIGQRILNKNYKEVKIIISFNPITQSFEVKNKATENSNEWIDDIHPIVNDEVGITKAIREYAKKNPSADENLIEQRIENLKKLKNRQVGIIELDHTLDIDTVTEIFTRINNKGVKLSNADFVMSKIASDTRYQGNTIRKAIDYFCRLVVDSDFIKHIENNDSEFKKSEFMNQISWIADNTDDLYIPAFSDILRVAFTYKFKRGKFSDLVALLSGRNFEIRSYEDSIAEDSFRSLKEGVISFVNKTNYQRFLMLVQSTGLVDNRLISSKNSLNFAYALYLKLKEEEYPEATINSLVKRWLIMTILLGRYSGSAESYIDEDIKAIHEKGIKTYLAQMEKSYLDEGFWNFGLVNDLETSSTNNNAYTIYRASKISTKTVAFLSKDVTIASLVEQRGDIHHIFPKKYLQNQGDTRRMYNQVANYVEIAQNINIKIGMKSPSEYMNEIQDDIASGKNQITDIQELSELERSITENDLPMDFQKLDYKDFLEKRRQLMASRIKDYYHKL